MAGSAAKEGQSTANIDVLFNSITFYTNQLEEYDRSNFTACMSCIGFVGGIISVIGAILCASSSVPANSVLMSRVIPALLLLIPGIITLFLYNFAMNCRRSAILRGYVQFLEDQLNQMLGQKTMLYSSFVIPDKYAKFPVNKYGPIAMFVILTVIYVICLVCAPQFAFYEKTIRWYQQIDIFSVMGILFALGCIVLTICYVIALTKNDEAMAEIKFACLNKSTEKVTDE